MIASFIQSLARRAVQLLVAHHGEKHDAFPDEILSGLQSAAGASPAALQQLDEFIHQFFVFDMPRNFFIQMAVAGTCIGILVIIGVATIASRITQKSFWLFKATRRSEGIYIVPNALNTFLIFEGSFAFVWITFIIVQWKAYGQRIGAMQQHVAVLNLIVWWPLWIGAFMAAWGSFYTAPGALDKGPLRSHSLSKHLARPLVINIICFGTPIILIVSLIPLIVLAQRHLNAAFAVYEHFASDIHAVIASGAMATPQQAQQFLARADAIWDMQVDTGYYMGIGYAIWPIWAGVFLVLYLPAGGYLVYLVWTQVRRQKATLDSLRQQYADFEAKERSEAAAAARPSGSDTKDNSSRQYSDDGVAMRQIITIGENRSMGNNGAEAALPDVSSSLLFRPLTSSQAAADTSAADSTSPAMPPRTAANPHVTIESRSNSPDSERNSHKHRSSSDVATAEEKEVFFPALRPEFRRRMAAAARAPRQTSGSVAVSGSPYARYKYLRRCLINLTILYVAIVLGASLYLGVSASLGRWLHTSYMQGPEQVTHIVYVCCVVTAWGAVVFGSLCILAILARLIDPANSPATGSSKGVAGNDEKRARGEMVRRMGMNGVSGPSSGSPNSMLRKPQWGSGADKVRALPAVPESVGATVDELMTGVSIPTSSWQPQRQTILQQQYYEDTNSSGSVVPRRMSSLEYISSMHSASSSRGETALSPRRKATSEQQRSMRFALHERHGTDMIFDPTSTGTSMASYGLPDARTVAMGGPDNNSEEHLSPTIPEPTAQGAPLKRIATVSRLRRLGKLGGGSTEELDDRLASMPTSSDAPTSTLSIPAYAMTDRDQISSPIQSPVVSAAPALVAVAQPVIFTGPLEPSRAQCNVEIVEAAEPAENTETGDVDSSLMDSPPPLSITSIGTRSSGLPGSPLSPVTPTTASTTSAPPTRPPRSASRQHKSRPNALFAGIPSDVGAEDKAEANVLGIADEQQTVNLVHISSSFSQHRGYGDADGVTMTTTTQRRMPPAALKSTADAVSSSNSLTFGPWSVHSPCTSNALDLTTPTSDDISPVRMTRSAGLQSSKALHPPPRFQPPSPPMSARSAMSDVCKPTHMHLFVERQPVPSPTQAWTPIGQSGWHLVPPTPSTPMAAAAGALVPQDVVDEEDEEEDDGDDATTFDDAHSSLGTSEGVHHVGSVQRRLSVVPLPGTTETDKQLQRDENKDGVIFNGITVDELDRQQQRRASLQQTSVESKDGIAFTRRRSSLMTMRSEERHIPGGYF